MSKKRSGGHKELNQPNLGLLKLPYLKIGVIVGQTNIVEGLINEVIASYYVTGDSESASDTFSRDVLFSGYLTLENKLKLIGKIATHKGISVSEYVGIDGLKKWRLMRNIVAHGIPAQASDGSVHILLGDEHHDLENLRKRYGYRHEKIVNLLRKLNTNEHSL